MEDEAQQKRRRTLVIIGVVSVVALAALVILFSPRAEKTATLPKEEEAPQAVTIDRSKAKVDYALPEFGKYGFTVEQANVLRNTLVRFAQTINKPLDKAEINLVTLQSKAADRSSADGTNRLWFDITFDGTVYKAQVAYIGLYRLNLFVYDQQDKLLFDSKMVDARSLPR